MTEQLSLLSRPSGRTRVWNVRTVPLAPNGTYLPGDVYVGRPGQGEEGRWGNPYSVQEYGPDEAMRRYVHLLAESWFNGDAGFRHDALTLLAGHRLLCFCLSHEWDTSLALPKRLCHAIPLALCVDMTRGLECPAASRWPEIREAAEHARWKESA